MPVATSASLLPILFFFPFLVRNKLGPLWPKMPVAVGSLSEGPPESQGAQNSYRSECVLLKTDRKS